ncbi:MAG: GAF domain-containing protein [Armatimonadetes bacterium]|nr:GAF domain-containing protein [Armatimonadota bacterium]
MTTEQARIKVLAALDVLDTQSEWRFDSITALACHILSVPVAALSLVSEDRQWFKSNIGLPFDGTPRSQSFCDHTVRQNEVFCVENASDDERFADIPLVSELKFKFYAGAPVRVDGQNVGSLCVLDRRSHTMTPDESSALMLLSQIAASMLQSDLQIRILQDELECLNTALDAVRNKAA